MNRRSFVLRGSAAATGAWLGLPSLGAAAEDPDVNLLVAMDDTAVRKKVGEVFVQCLRASPSVKSTFFPATPEPEYKPAAQASRIDELATMLAAWSLAHVASYGFSGTVNEANAKSIVTRDLSLNDGQIRAFSEDVYKHFFPDLCTANGVTFRSLQGKPDIGQHYCTVIASDSFYVKTIPLKKSRQYLHLLLYMADVLDPRAQWKKAAYDRWGKMSGEAPWTTYQYISAMQFTEQTFLPEVQAACNKKEQISAGPGRMCVGRAGGGAPTCFPHGTVTQFGYGYSVENWVNQQKKNYGGAFTDHVPGNKITEQSG